MVGRWGALERLSEVSWVPRWVRWEHDARYAFAGQFVNGYVVVDCACGEGRGSWSLAHAGASRVEAVDVSAAAVAHAQSHYHAPVLSFWCADALTLPITTAFADVVVCLETLEHLLDDRRFLAEACRVLKPSGLFICSTPNRTVTNPGTTLADPPWNRFHQREHARSDLTELLSSAFGQIDWYGQNPCSAARIQSMRRLAACGSPSLAVWAMRLWKLPRFLWDAPAWHVVHPLRPHVEYEYVVAVCRSPRNGDPP